MREKTGILITISLIIGISIGFVLSSMFDLDFFDNTQKVIDDELLPIGSIVSTDIVEQDLMIYGRKQTQDGQDRVWDYVATPYPHGHFSSDTNIFFDHVAINELIYKGLETEEEIEFRQQLTE
ncbi:DUF4176 domain-containing protein [Amphibacillus cookii]|uniref:DUF4176 domain-containing protein n=1 Tax=Amphibacillus cookii TaxID=767787 RepID=UPI001EF9216D|nr:DUF4176 domain-containing protein [Amphibacillus cookii]MBM7543018.1 hypothetical protein [Amphibacillus cookii]